jgi:hypothetical protein
VSLLPKLINKQPIYTVEFHRIVANHLKKILPIRVRKYFLPDQIEKNQVAVTGYYHYDRDEQGKKSIELVFSYNNFLDRLKLNLTRIKNIGALIADTILHEIIHMSQFRKKDFLLSPEYSSNAKNPRRQKEQSYLGKPDEIDAYAFNVVCELADKFKNNHVKIIKYINDNQKRKRRKFNSWIMYIKAFEHDHDHPVIRKLKKKIIRYLPQCQIGKSYNQNKWLEG